MRNKIVGFLFFLTVFSLYSMTNTFVALSTFVTPNKVPENQTFRVDINIQYDTIKDYSFSSPVLTGTRNCEIVGTGVANSVVFTNDRKINVRKYSYTLKPTGLGQAYFGSVSVLYSVDGVTNTLYSKDVPVTVTLPKIKKKSYVSLIILIVLFIILLIVAIYVLVKKIKIEKKKKLIELEKEKEASISLEEKKYQKFLSIREDKDKIDSMGYFDRLIKILKEYLMEKFSIERKSITEQELSSFLPDEYEYKTTLQNWFEKSYNIKYGNSDLSEKDITEFENFINSILKS